jgi:hypothetical protein
MLSGGVLIDLPRTPEERQARLGQIKIEITAEHSRYKVHQDAYLRSTIRMGLLLLEAKEIVGHKNFGAWVNNNCPFSHRTANNYMEAAAYVPDPQQKTKFARLANLTEEGMQAAIAEHNRKRASAAAARSEAADRVAEQLDPETTAGSSFPSFRSKRRQKNQQRRAGIRAAVRTVRRQLTAQLTQEGLEGLWPQPRLDSAGVMIEGRRGEDIQIWMFVWLPEDASAQAAYEVAVATRGHYQGIAALTYHWILLHQLAGEPPTHWPVQSDANGARWEEVQAKVLEVSRDATSVDQVVQLDRDPIRSRILDFWRETRRR